MIVGDITQMAYALDTIAVCSVVALLRSFGLFRGLK